MNQNLSIQFLFRRLIILILSSSIFIVPLSYGQKKNATPYNQNRSKTGGQRLTDTTYKILAVRPLIGNSGETIQLSVAPPIGLRRNITVKFDSVSAEVKIVKGMVFVTIPPHLNVGSKPQIRLTVDNIDSTTFDGFQIGIRKVTQTVSYKITRIVPQKASPGELVTIHITPVPDSKQNIYATFDGRSAESVFEKASLNVRVPSNLTSGSKPVIVVHISNMSTPRFEGFSIEELPLRILAVTPSLAKVGDTVKITLQPPYQFPNADRQSSSVADDLRYQINVRFASTKGKIISVSPDKLEITAIVPQEIHTDTVTIIVSVSDQQSSPYVDFRISHKPQNGTSGNSLQTLIGFVGLIGFILFWLFFKRSSEKSPPKGGEGTDAVPEKVFRPLPGVPEELVKACVNKECILFLGAGLTAQGGGPTWELLLNDVIKKAQAGGQIEANFADELFRTLNAGDTATVSDSLSTKLDRQWLRKTLKEMLGLDSQNDSMNMNSIQQSIRGVFTPSAKKPPSIFRLFSSIPFAGIISTTFDRFTEDTYSKTSPSTLAECEKLINDLRDQRFFILKLNGDLNRNETILFGLRDLRKSIYSSPQFSQFLNTLFFTRTIFFVGVSFKGMEDFLNTINIQADPNKTHFALIDDKITSLAQVELYKRRYGIEVLQFTPSQDYSEIPTFIENLQEKVNIASDKITTHSSQQERLLKVKLQNIGSFENLEIDLRPHWNVFLGDNGVGKSTILKSIAVGLIGGEAESYAAHLLRAGQDTGFIELVGTKNIYKTTFERTSTGVKVTQPLISPMISEGWLVLGFSPLRQGSWKRPTGPQQSAFNFPMPSDLIPLITGEQDTRLDDVKQWIVNTDYRATKDRNTEDKQLLENFFTIIQKITPHVTVKFHDVDSRTFEVRVETEDGIVPIELISQGTSSILGWVGTVHQRIFDVGGKDINLENASALVLVDEIDAHLHPLWQQMLIPKLKEVFKEIQFVVTTHSPLIVLGLEKEDVFQVRREGSKTDPKRRVIVEQPSFDFKGWRADQLLTGPLFGLESTVDPQRHQEIQTYTELSSKDSLTPEDEKQLEELSQRLSVRLPSPHEREESRMAFDNIREALEKQLDDIPIEKRNKVLNEAKVQMTENITGSRRPQ